MNILVTGGAGFVGSHVVRRLLRDGHRVRILDSLMYGGAPLLDLWGRPDVDVQVGDVRDADARTRAVDGMDAVVHLAAIVGDPACKRRPESWAVNHDATLGLIEATRAGSPTRFVFVSTCSNYGVSDSGELVTEDAPLNPVSLYAESKVAAEKVLLQTVDDGFDPIVLRLATVYGVSPRMRFDLLVNDFTREAVVRKKIVIYGEQFWRPHVHAADVARAMSLAVAAPRDDARPRVFNVGDDDQNFQKLAIAELARDAVPGTVIETVQKDEDPRSYRVGFGRIRDVFEFRISRTAKDGVDEVRALLQAGVVTDHDDPRYVN